MGITKIALDWGPLEAIAVPFRVGETVGSTVRRTLDFIFPLAGFVLLIYLVIGGFKFLTSGGDPKKIAEAKGTITTALIGFALVFFAYWIVQIIARILDLQPILDVFPGA